MRHTRGVLLLIGLAALAAGAGIARTAGAHPLAPSLLELSEAKDGEVAVLFRTPRLQRPGATPTPELPPDCRPLGPPGLSTDAESATLRFDVRCSGAGLAGARVGVRGLRESGTDALLRVKLASGDVVRTLLRPGAESFELPLRPTRLAVVGAWLALGFEHLLGGLDHLLFVLGLVLLLRDRKSLLVGVTGFTLGHSVTLSLAVLGFVRAPAALVEIGIAASLFWLATRLARGEARRPPPAAHAWRMPGLFGLLHGFGFAGALAQAGLPAGEIPLALFAFNLGIELGQLAVVAALLGLRGLLAPWRARLPAWLARAPAYAIGTLATLLILERTSGAF